MRVLSHKIRIYPNNKAILHFAMCFGAARFAYNWALDFCKKAHEDGRKCPSGYDLSNALTVVKKSQFRWMYDVSKWVTQRAVLNLGDAFQNFFKKKSRFPKFKKKGKCRDSFYINADNIQVEGNHIRLPKIGWIRMSQSLRFSGKPLSVVISKQNEKFYASIQVELSDSYIYPHSCKSQAGVGIDVGVNDLLVLDTGEKFKNPRILKSYLSKLRRLQRSLSRKQKDSKNRVKARLALAKCHEKIRNLRLNNIHGITSSIVERFGLIGVEDLNVSGMLKNHKLAKSISDASLSEIRRQFEYKSKFSGSVVFPVDRFFPSSKLCSVCGWKKEDLVLSDREWRCESCGMVHDRDINAARNILREAARGYREAGNACGEDVRHVCMQSLEKQEGGVSC
jgi:putative transposase